MLFDLVEASFFVATTYNFVRAREFPAQKLDV